jgi:hypothetical protein
MSATINLPGITTRFLTAAKIKVVFQIWEKGEKKVVGKK